MRIVHLAPALLGVAMLASAPAHAQAAAPSARHYDCSKPGNANKAVCKGAATAAAKPATPAVAAAPASKLTVARNYDCSKPGNASKAVCRSAAAAKPAPVAAPAPSVAARAASAGAPIAVSARTAGKATAAAGPSGATAQCRDGTYSHSTHRAGTCAGHKGVQTWY